VIIPDGDSRHFGFSKIRNFNGKRQTCVTVPNLMKIGQTVAEIWRFNGFFQKGGLRHVGFVGRLFGPPTTTT